jgi:hypothetical protein
VPPCLNIISPAAAAGNKFNRLNMIGINPLTSTNFVSNYPLKSSFEDFYRSNNLSKNSVTMAKCSQEQVKTINNF